MSENRTVKRVTKSDLEIARNDPALSLIYRAKSKADLQTMVDSMGIVDSQHAAMMLGLLIAAWITLRKAG